MSHDIHIGHSHPWLILRFPSQVCMVRKLPSNFPVIENEHLRDPGRPVGLGEQEMSRDGTKFCSIHPTILCFTRSSGSEVSLGMINSLPPPLSLFISTGVGTKSTFESLTFSLSMG